MAGACAPANGNAAPAAWRMAGDRFD